MSLFLKRHKILCQSNRINSKHFCQKYFSQKSENQIDDKIPKENKQINDEEYSLHYDHDKLIDEDEKFIQDIPGPNNDRSESIETQYQNWRIAKKPFEKRLDLIKKARIPSYKMLTDHLEEFAENSRLEDVKFQANHERKYNKEDAEKVLSHKPKPKEFKTRHFKKDFLDKNILSFKENPETYQKATYVSLLKSGIHYGSKTTYTNPLMYQFIYCERNKQHIFDVTKSLAALRKVMMLLQAIAEKNGSIWFVGHSDASKKSVEQYALKCGEPFIVHKYHDGILTNFSYLSSKAKERRFFRMDKAENRDIKDVMKKYARYRLSDGIPSIIVLMHKTGNEILINEADRVGIPVACLCDSDVDPSRIMYVIPGNDDNEPSVRYVMEMLSNAILEKKKNIRFWRKLIDIQRKEPKKLYSPNVKPNLSLRKGLTQIEMLNPKIVFTNLTRFL